MGGLLLGLPVFLTGYIWLNKAALIAASIIMVLVGARTGIEIYIFSGTFSVVLCFWLGARFMKPKKPTP